MRSSRLAAAAAMALFFGVPSAMLRARSSSLDIDRGAAGAWQAINKLATVASLLHTTAHPDDEQGGMLAVAGRQWGARTALLTLNRGEAGDNAIGPELFDALGLIRTDELARAAEYYDLDEQYFTLAADYGYSKRLDEALERWDRRALIGDMVRAIRTSRPLVVVSRWQGGARDGHGQHQAAGALTPEAVAAAADPDAYPELARQGLRPWRVLRLYVGGVREEEPWQVRVPRRWGRGQRDIGRPPARSVATRRLCDGVARRPAPGQHRDRTLTPPRAAAPQTFTIGVQVTSHAASPVRASVSLEVPSGWAVTPASAELSLDPGGNGRVQPFQVSAPVLERGAWPLRASATVGGRRYAQSYHVIRHRGLPVRYAVSEAEGKVTAIDVEAPKGVRVGYVMGVGDEVPAALAQLGARVTLLGRNALAASDLNAFDTIVTGTRAYAVRDDLRAFNGRLLEWVRSGGNLVVLYNTPEFDPRRFAPFAGRLPEDAEEVAEERAPVTLLAAGHPLLTTPNRIAAADFEGWIEQRGSKFFSEWDAAYVPLVECHDRDQPPQRGGWLTAAYGKGHWTYMAYALHRQLPAGVPGAYRLLANLISLGRSDTPR